MEKYSSPHLRLHGKPEDKAKSKSQPEKGKGPMDSEGSHGAQPEHVTKTHPGETQPHPKTGVHAVHVHHTGGGMHNVHVHHDGGKVESHHGVSAEEAKQIHAESLPSEDEQQQEPAGDEFAESGSMPPSMSSLGGA